MNRSIHQLSPRDNSAKKILDLERSDLMNEKKLSLFGFFALTASMVLTVYEYPTFCHVTTSFGFLLIIRRYPLVFACCTLRGRNVDGKKAGRTVGYLVGLVKH